MNSIEVDDEVLAELARRVVGFNVTPNDVLRQIIGLAKDQNKSAPISQDAAPLPVNSAPLPVAQNGASSAPTQRATLRAFIESTVFQSQSQTINRFLLLLLWAHTQNPEAFSNAVLDFQRGNRRYFGKAQEEVENSGVGIKAKAIPTTPFWVLATLDNKAKRTIIEDLFRSLGHTPADLNLAKEQLADSNIRRSHSIALQYLK